MRIYVGTTERNLEAIKAHVTERADGFSMPAGTERDDFIWYESEVHAAYIKFLDAFEAIASKLKEHPIGTLTVHVRTELSEMGQFILQPTEIEGYDFALGVFSSFGEKRAKAGEAYDFGFDDLSALRLEEIKICTDAITQFLTNFSVVEVRPTEQPQAAHSRTPKINETIILAAIRHLARSVAKNEGIDHLSDILDGYSPTPEELNELAMAINLGDLSISAEPLSITIHKYEDSFGVVSFDVMADDPDGLQVQVIDSTSEYVDDESNEGIVSVRDTTDSIKPKFAAVTYPMDVQATRLAID